MTRTAPQRSSRRGYSLVELIVALLVTVFVIGGAYTLLQSGTDFATEQRGRIQMQESARGAFDVVAEFSRGAGFGGLPVDTSGREMPEGIALAVRNNVSSSKILLGSTAADVPDVADDTDVLIIRGSLDDQTIYRLSTDPESSFVLDSVDDTQGDLYVFQSLPSGQVQDLADLQKTVEDAKGTAGKSAVPEALLVSSSFDPEVYCVLQLDPDRSDVTDPTRLKLRVLMPNKLTSRVANQYQSLCPNQVFPDIMYERLQQTTHGPGELFVLGTLTVLQERRFYLRKTTDAENEHPVLPPLPMLSSAKVLPGTELAYRDDVANLREDVATGLIDFQIELGFDTGNGGTWASGAVMLEVPDGTLADDWLFNHPSDDATKAPWAARAVGDPEPLFQYLRLRMVALTDQVDRRHLATDLSRVADHIYPAGHVYNQSPYTTLRRLELVTTLDVRNLRRYR